MGRSKEGFAEIIQLLEQGKSVEDVSEITNTTRVAILKRLKRHGVDIEPYKKVVKSTCSQYDSLIRKMLDDGCKYAEIGRTIGVRRETVRFYCRYRKYTDAFPTPEKGKIKNDLLEYISGYENNRSVCKVRCLKCGHVFERRWDTLISYYCSCPACKETRKEQEKEQKAEKRRIEAEQRARLRKEAAKKRWLDNHRQEAEQIQKLVDQHLSKQQIVDQTGFSRNKVNQIVKQFGITMKWEYNGPSHSCPVCGTITKRPKYCSVQCRNKTEYKSREVIRRMRIRNAMVDNDITVHSLYNRDNGYCHICGRKTDLEDYVVMSDTMICGNWYPSIDHVIPLSKGGEHSWQNVKLAHRICNSLKSDKVG